MEQPRHDLRPILRGAILKHVNPGRDEEVVMNSYCWEDGADHNWAGHTCMAPDGHPADEHVWIPDTETVIDFL